jgi:hypothetical protein
MRPGIHHGRGYCGAETRQPIHVLQMLAALSTHFQKGEKASRSIIPGLSPANHGKRTECWSPRKADIHPVIEPDHEPLPRPRRTANFPREGARDRHCRVPSEWSVLASGSADIKLLREFRSGERLVPMHGGVRHRFMPEGRPAAEPDTPRS